jgi:peptidyl-prolyl cis-trans isomerase D
MLESMRKHAKYYYVLFFIIIVTFILWVPKMSDNNPPPAVVAEIGSQSLKAADYWDTYRRASEMYREEYRNQPTDEARKQFDERLKKMVLDSMVEERILLSDARDLGITVSDQELQQAIVTNPAFQRDGVFKKEVYAKTVNQQLRLSQEAFEAKMREQLTADKMRRLIATSAGITDLDVRNLPADPTRGETLKQLVLYSKQNAVLRAYMDSARARLKVTINQEALL